MVAKRLRSIWRLMAIYAIGAVACIAAVAPLASSQLNDAEAESLRCALVAAVVLTTIVVAPLFALMMWWLRAVSAQNAGLHDAATHDEMTGLLNWSAFHAAIAAADAHGGDSGARALLLVDVDYFKAVNDRWGHHAGDAVLQTVAGTIARQVGSLGIVGRLGGEEFGVLLTGTAVGAAQATADALRRLVASACPRLADGTLVALTVSIGCVVYAAPTQGGAALLHVDRLMYRAKAKGRNRVEFESINAPVGCVAAIDGLTHCWAS